jgi:membrane-associated phospholipid phosphatase
MQLPQVLAFEATTTAIFQLVCASLVTLFIIAVCIPWLHQPARATLRPWVVYHVEAGVSIVAAAQKYNTPWLTWVFVQSSHSVSVGFYGSFLPALIWLGLPELGWHLVVLMSLTLYVGNAMKDLVCAPRPLNVAYGRAKLAFSGIGSGEADLNAKEYGLPSSHTMNSLCLNFYSVHYLREQGVIDDSAAVAAYTTVVLWVAWIATSRIYLSLHTPIDILAGAVAGLTVVTTFIYMESLINAWAACHASFVALSSALLALVLLRLHPRPLNPTPSFEFSTAFMGVLFGVLTGVSRNRGFFEPPLRLRETLSMSPLWHIRRLTAGFAIVLACKEVFRAIAYAILPVLYQFFPIRLRRMWQPPVHSQYPLDAVQDPRLKGLPHGASGRPCDVEATSRFFAYAGIGFAACEIAPRLFMIMDW